MKALSACLSLLQQCCSIGELLAIGFVAGDFEALDGLAYVLVHLLLDEEDAVQMVGHDLGGQHLDGGVVVRNSLPISPDLLA